MEEGSHDEDFGEEEEEDYLEEQDDLFNEQGEFSDEEDYGGSEPPPLGGVYGILSAIINKPSSLKVSNVNKEELGNLGITVRDCVRIALLGKTFGHKKFANFFMNQAGIITDTAMSKDGWIAELVVTSKKYTSRASSSSIKELPQFGKRKWKMFSSKQGKESQLQ